MVSDRAEQQFIHMEVGQFDPTGGPFRMVLCTQRGTRRFNT